MFDGKKLTHNFEPVYLGVKLDRSLTYGKHIDKLRLKEATRNLLRKLAGTSWGAFTTCLRATALALVYTCAEYCSSSWLNSAHAEKVDVEFNKAMSNQLPWNGCQHLVISHHQPLDGRIFC